MAPSVLDRLVGAIAAQDEARVAACFADDATFRALIPPGVRERQGASETAALIASWFADSTQFELIGAETSEIGDRARISYRFSGIEDGASYVVEQHLCCTVVDDRIERADLLCSGFRPA